MSDIDYMRRRLDRLARLRRLGLHRGAGGLAQDQRGREGGLAASDLQTGNANHAQVAACPETGSAVDQQLSSGAGMPGAMQGGPDHYDGLMATVQLPGESIETPFGPAWVRTERFPLSEHPKLAEWLRVTPAAAVALDRNNALWGIDPATVAFIDTETTGLALDASTYTFLIGVGMYESDGGFVVSQYFMRNPAEERAQLYLVEQALSNCTGIVSFNGRGFDMPLITNRFVLAEMSPPLPGAPHLDLLPPARRLWRARWGSCSLGNLERNVLGLVRTADDVPGYLIPDIYRDYYRTGIVTDMLVRVFYHNSQDIVSMPLLAARMAQPFREAQRACSLNDLHPLECLSLGRCYDALAWTEASIEAYQVALSGILAPSERAQALRELGFLYKRLQQRDRAVALWEDWISTLPGEDLTPYIELAKHYEWHAGDLVAARGWAAWALRIAENSPSGYNRDILLAELQHRLARLESKLSGVHVDRAGPED